MAFIGVQEGTTFTEPPTSTVVGNLLGWDHFALGDVGDDMLPNVGSGGGAQGFIPPLLAGDYTFWMQQTGAEATTYRFDFVVVPGPSGATVAAVGVLTGVCALRFLRRRRRDG